MMILNNSAMTQDLNQETAIGETVRETLRESTSSQTEHELSQTLASLSLTTELDSALLSHLSLLDKYMFHMECLSQHFRMALSPHLCPLT
jgi:hypothetical protein